VPAFAAAVAAFAAFAAGAPGAAVPAEAAAGHAVLPDLAAGGVLAQLEAAAACYGACYDGDRGGNIGEAAGKRRSGIVEVSRRRPKGTPMARKIVVVGWGLAAHRLVTGLLAADTDVDVTVYAGEGAVAHDRSALPGTLAGAGIGAPDGEAAAYDTTAATLPAPDDPRLNLRAGVRAMAVDRMHRLVHGSDQWVQPYDTLILATGANAVLPPIKGLRTADGEDLLPGIHSAHHVADFRRLAEAAATATHAVVIGGSTTGLDVAAGLRLMRAEDPLHVELIDQTPARPEITPTDAYLTLRRTGVIAYQDCRARALTAGPDGALDGVLLADGHRLSADLAVIACGTAPNTALAWTSGLAVARGIVVDDTLRSVSDPHIHALGACAEHRRSLSGRHETVLAQADVLAARLSGLDPHRTYRGPVAQPAPNATSVVAEAEALLRAAA
jgi:NAD(P)H-nitrite reductase large subunit